MEVTENTTLDEILEELKKETREEEQAEFLRDFAYYQKKNKEKLVASLKEKYPIQKSEPYIHMFWSEHPALSNEDEDFSLRAMDEILTNLEVQMAVNDHILGNVQNFTAWGGYAKTKYAIIDENGEQLTTDRFDIGDGRYDGNFGLFNQKIGWLKQIARDENAFDDPGIVSGLQNWNNLRTLAYGRDNTKPNDKLLVLGKLSTVVEQEKVHSADAQKLDDFFYESIMLRKNNAEVLANAIKEFPLIDGIPYPAIRLYGKDFPELGENGTTMSFWAADAYLQVLNRRQNELQNEPPKITYEIYTSSAKRFLKGEMEIETNPNENPLAKIILQNKDIWNFTLKESLMKKDIMITSKSGQEIPYNIIEVLMDDDIRENLHRELAPCSEEKFLAEYCKEHQAKYHEEFRIDDETFDISALIQKEEQKMENTNIENKETQALTGEKMQELIDKFNDVVKEKGQEAFKSNEYKAMKAALSSEENKNNRFSIEYSKDENIPKAILLERDVKTIEDKYLEEQKKMVNSIAKYVNQNGELPWNSDDFPKKAAQENGEKATKLMYDNKSMSKAAYSEFNQMKLSLAAIEKGYKDNRWVTRNYILQNGGYIRRGEHAEKIFSTVVTDASKELTERKVARFHSVFNINQTESLPMPPLQEQPLSNKIHLIDEVISKKPELQAEVEANKTPKDKYNYAQILHNLGRGEEISAKPGPEITKDASPEEIRKEIVAEISSAFLKQTFKSNVSEKERPNKLNPKIAVDYLKTHPEEMGAICKEAEMNRQNALSYLKNLNKELQKQWQVVDEATKEIKQEKTQEVKKEKVTNKKKNQGRERER